jgi:hypothetical protein
MMDIIYNDNFVHSSLSLSSFCYLPPPSLLCLLSPLLSSLSSPFYFILLSILQVMWGQTEIYLTSQLL